LKLLTNIKKQKLLEWISISWWEPLLELKKVIQLTKLLNSLNIKNIELEVQTNWYFLNKQTFEMLVKKYNIKKFFISFHHHEKTTYERITQIKWSYEKILLNLKEIDKLLNNLDKDIEITLAPVFTKQTYKDIPNYFKFIYNNFKNFKKINLSFCMPIWRWKNFSLNLSDYLSLKEKNWLEEWFNKGFQIYNPYAWLPLCSLQWYRYLEYTHDYQIFISKKKKKDPQKYYPFFCKNCKFKKICSWIWKL